MCYYPLRNIIPTQIPLILLSTGKEQETISPQFVSQVAAFTEDQHQTDHRWTSGVIVLAIITPD